MSRGSRAVSVSPQPGLHAVLCFISEEFRFVVVQTISVVSSER